MACPCPPCNRCFRRATISSRRLHSTDACVRTILSAARRFQLRACLFLAAAHSVTERRCWRSGGRTRRGRHRTVLHSLRLLCAFRPQLAPDSAWNLSCEVRTSVLHACLLHSSWRWHDLLTASRLAGDKRTDEWVRHERLQPFSEELASQCVHKRPANGCASHCTQESPLFMVTLVFASLPSVDQASGSCLPAHVTAPVHSMHCALLSQSWRALARDPVPCREDDEGQKRMTRRHRSRLEHSSIKGEFSVLDFKVC
jgi:hypothetical protein